VHARAFACVTLLVIATACVLEGYVMFQEDSRRFGVVLTKPGDARADGKLDT
jgi:hypothetical protein